MFYFKTYGREYQFTLESDGLIHCKDLGLSAPTAEELKPLVSAAVKAEKAAPRIPVIVIDDRWSYVFDWTPGSASSKADRNGYRWVSYKDGQEEKAKPKRRTFDSDRLFADTPENRDKADQLVDLGRTISALMNESKQLKSSMTTVSEYLEAQAEVEAE